MGSYNAFFVHTTIHRNICVLFSTLGWSGCGFCPNLQSLSHSLLRCIVACSYISPYHHPSPPPPSRLLRASLRGLPPARRRFWQSLRRASPTDTSQSPVSAATTASPLPVCPLCTLSLSPSFLSPSYLSLPPLSLLSPSSSLSPSSNQT